MSGIPAGLRGEFPLLARKAYLNSCSYGALSRSVKSAVEGYLETRLTDGARWDLWVGELENVRGRLAALLGCASEDVSVSTSVSESLNSLASALPRDGGRDTIVVTDFDFPTTAHIWLAQSACGRRIVRVDADDSASRCHWSASMRSSTNVPCSCPSRSCVIATVCAWTRRRSYKWHTRAAHASCWTPTRPWVRCRSTSTRSAWTFSWAVA